MVVLEAPLSPRLNPIAFVRSSIEVVPHHIVARGERCGRRRFCSIVVVVALQLAVLGESGVTKEEVAAHE